MSEPSLHLWIKPSGDAYEALARAIQKLTRDLDCPVFEPHVTLLGYVNGSEEETAQRTKELASELEPFEIALTDPAYRDEYFRCLFMRVAETQPMMNANVCAARLFNKTQPPYEPHVSLVYGHLSEARKKAIIQSLPGDVQTRFEARTICVIRADSADPRDWHEVADFPLGG